MRVLTAYRPGRRERDACGRGGMRARPEPGGPDAVCETTAGAGHPCFHEPHSAVTSWTTQLPGPARHATAAPVARDAQLRLQRGLERSLGLILLVAFYYCWYRYPFRINATTTSPTYANTPVWIAAGKYFLIAGALVYAMVARTASRTPVSLGHPAAVMTYLYLSLVPLAVALPLRYVDFMEAGFFFLVPLVLSIFAGARLPYLTVNRFLRGFLYISLVVEAIQVALFVTIGRLPAQAYRGSLLVRFGSLLDDPSGYTFLIAWMLPFVGYYYRGVRRLTLFVLLGFCVLLSQSFTGAIAVMAVTALFVVLTVIARPRSIFVVLLATLAVSVLVGSFFLTYQREIEFFYQLYLRQGKGGSISEHAYALDLLRNLRLMNLLGLEPTHHDLSETAYVNVLGTMGVPYLLVYVGAGLAALWRALKILWHPRSDREMKAFAAGAIGLLTAIYVGCLALPVFVMFPLNLLGSVVLGLLLTFDVHPPGSRQWRALAETDPLRI